MFEELYDIPAFAPETNVTESEELFGPAWSGLILGDSPSSIAFYLGPESLNNPPSMDECLNLSLTPNFGLSYEGTVSADIFRRDITLATTRAAWLIKLECREKADEQYRSH